ncbi:MAG TPA: DNA/RNA helicase domain-containing protein [Acetobacteraceae bacterium]|nr:DNA/RNA helicase domain-containing protein [Acetobacteraceae bacterium]
MAPEDVAARLAAAQARRHATIELTQLRAWEAQARILREALAGAPEDWRLHLECDLLRLERRVDAVLLTGRAILVLEFKHGARGYAAADLRQTEDYALDLHDFHAGSRAHPLVPVLVATHAPGVPFDPPLIWHGVAPAQRTNAAGLAALIAAMERAIPAPATPIDAAGWIGKPYRPVPSVLEAATLLYRRNAVGEIAEARADAANLTRTADAIARTIAEARRDGARIVVFVTGIPGAGKTLCGLNVVFGALREHGAAFLTGNVPLVTVLREALARNAAPEGGRRLKAERDLARKALQNVHRFLEEHVGLPDHAPDTRIIVFDEAQRAWDEAQATRDTQRRVSRLSMSEPAHTLEIMGRHAGWSVVVALIGGGQEINTGEAGLAQWGRVIEVTGSWRAVAPPSALSAPDPAQRLADGPRPWLSLDAALDLRVPLRSVRDAAAAPWVDAVLRGEVAEAAGIAAASGALPMLLTRSLEEARRALRGLARGLRRTGLVASAGAKRLRAEGLGVQAAEVADWFLSRWPDIRSSEALETFATEYDCQGLELDMVGLAWGGDLIRRDGSWMPRRFAGDRWFTVRGAEERRFILNTYRVLLTRARYETVIWVPQGSRRNEPWHDATRDAAEMDEVARFLLACGARPLEDALAPEDAAPAGLL